MMRRYWLTGLVMALCALMSGVYADNDSHGSDSQKDDQVLADVQSAVTVTPKVRTFAIKLKANPTTGYQWYLKSASRGIQPGKRDFQEPEKQIPGRGGYLLWHFTVSDKMFDAPRVLKVRLVYKRPWEAKMEQSKTFYVHTQPESDE